MKIVTPEECLPSDLELATLVGRIWREDSDVSGPSVVAVRNGRLVDITPAVGTMAGLLDRSDALSVVRNAPGQDCGSVFSLVEQSLVNSRVHDKTTRLLAPCDLQSVKACGVTFAVSLLERLIEELAGGDALRAHELRNSLNEKLGVDVAAIKPGSPEAESLKSELTARGLWSQYLEVGLGPDAEVFTKAQPMSSVGLGAEIGILANSRWNNPEPEVVLAVGRNGEVRGATLGNDVNLRDIEGRSALLLGKAKDNNASCAIGPFIRLFDERYTIDTVRQSQVRLAIYGEDDGFELEEVSNMAKISRDPLELVRQTWGKHHQYPDGFMLFLGTMFSPVKDRDQANAGFTHHLGDLVVISTEKLGALVNTVQLSSTAAPWEFGIRSLYQNLLQRNVSVI